MSFYPGFFGAFEELVSVMRRQVESEETWPLADWIAREMHAASAEEIAELLDRASAEVIAAVPDYQRRRVLAHLERMRANASDAMASELSGRAEPETVVDALHAMLHIVDPRLRTHLVSVGTLAARIASGLGLTGCQVRDIGIAGRLLDVGSIGLPGQLARRDGALDQGSLEIVRSHCVLGERMLAGMDHLRPYKEWVRMHHERLDGSGYPDGLRDDAIPIEVRILSVADVFSAMTATRPHRKAHAVVTAMDHLSANAGMLYDPLVVAALVRLISKDGGVRAGDPAAA